MTIIDDLFAVIPAHPDLHVPQSPMWRVWNAAARAEVGRLFADTDAAPVAFGPFGDIRFPYHEMGSINSLDLFGMDELIIFSFYSANRNRYRRVVDFGANIGLHSIVLARCGFQIRSFEPDPVHFDLLGRNLALNEATPELHQAAVSLEAGRQEFVRVLGNTTGSHIAGAKENPYGELERFEVAIEAAGPHLDWADLAKIDIEGHEAALLTGLDPTTWQATDAVVEIGTAENAAMVFGHLRGSGINMFAQKIGWAAVEQLADMPTSHREGSLFLTSKPTMPWAADS